MKTLAWRRDTLSADLGAALAVALVSIPSGMAYAIVAGVNPVYGLYSGMVTTLIASLAVSTSLMVVTLTNALALVTAERLAALGGDVDPVRAMFTLTFLTGVIMFGLGVLRLGSVIRFVSREVMSGFVFATALLIVLGQYKDLVGYTSQIDGNKVAKAIDITRHFRDWNPQTAALGAASIALLVLMKRSPLRRWADVLIILIASVAVAVLNLDSVKLVQDVAAVPSGLAALPAPVLPDFSVVPLLITGAVAAAIVGLAESSGVGVAFPNPDGTRSDMSRDFAAQGLGNLGGSLFQSMPAGGSLSRSGVNKSAGAQSRWAGVYGAILVALVLVLFGQYADLIPMSGLAALLTVIGFQVMAREWRELGEAWYVSRANVALAAITIAVGVLVDLTAAIFVGVALSLLSFAFVSATNFRLVQLILTPDRRWLEQPLAQTPRADEAIVVEFVGNPSFAAVYSLAEVLPDPEQMRNSVVILHQRDRMVTSLTGVKWLEAYAAKLKAHGNRFMVSGVSDRLMAMLKSLELVEVLGEENLVHEQPTLGAALSSALADAEAWIAANKPAPATELETDHRESVAQS